MSARHGVSMTVCGSAGLVLVALGAMAPGGKQAHAAQSDCEGVNNGSLNVQLGAGASDTRRVKLETGDKLTFEFSTSDSSLGTVALLRGAGSESPLLVGPAGTSVVFVAPTAGAFDFRFAKDGPEPATFSAACVPSAVARLEKRRASVRPLVLGLPRASPGEGQEFEDPAIADLAIGPKPFNAGSADAIKALPAAEPRDPETGLALKMELRDQRYAFAGPYGVQVDPGASGVNVGVNYKLQPAIMLGALAQFDQSAETLTGISRNLAEHAWMAGPVTKVQLAPNVALDASAAWGFADSGEVDLAARGPTMPRRMVSARLANTQTFGGWRLTPSIAVNHSWETMVAPGSSATEAYMTSTVSAGRVDVGPELAYRLDLANAAFIEPRAAIGSFWGIDGLAGAGHAEMRLKAEAGVTFGVVGGSKLQMGGAVEEGDGAVPDIWSGRLQMSVPLK